MEVLIAFAIGVMAFVLCQIPDEFARRIQDREPTKGAVLGLLLVLAMFAVSITATIPVDKRVTSLEAQIKELQDANPSKDANKDVEQQ